MNLQENIRKVLREETDIKPVLRNLLNMLFDGFEDIYYDWANYNCGMGECCDPYAIGFVLPEDEYDEYLFKLVDGDNYDDDGDYPKELRDELPEVCHDIPDVRNPNFNTIVMSYDYVENIENYMGSENNWNLGLLELINEMFGCNAESLVVL
jgi:hypothetical protein